MLLAIDVGNTNTVLGLYNADSPELIADWRITTHKNQTSDEYGVLFLSLFAMRQIDVSKITAIVVSSVVPPLDSTIRRLCERYFSLRPMFVEPGIKTGMPLLVDNPAELGADRIVNGVAAFARYGGPIIVVDFGTATTFDVITARGEYIGGVIAPGLGISADALFSRAAKLARVDIKRPARTIGTNTIAHLQSGLFYGYIGLVDGILERMLAEIQAGQPDDGTPAPKVIATGGLAHMLHNDSKYITAIDDMLTLDGLRLLYERNRNPRSVAHPKPPPRSKCRTTSTTSRKSKSTSSGVAAPFCCFPRSTGRSSIPGAKPECRWRLCCAASTRPSTNTTHARREQQTRTRMRKVNGLAWCAQAVMEAVEAMQEAAVGGAPIQTESPGLEQERIAHHLRAAAATFTAAGATIPSLAEIADAPGAARAQPPANEELERHLSALEEKLFALLLTHTPAEELEQMRDQAARELAPYRSRMQAVQIRQIEQQFLRRRLLERYDLPRISLFYMQQGE